MNTALKINNSLTRPYWTDADLKELELATSAKQMLPIAMRVLSKMPKGPIYQVCGPIGSGGYCDLEKNLNAFNKAICYLQERGLHVFDQMPFERPLQKIKKPNEYPHEILEDFYWPIFESGFITNFDFMKNWQTSFGAKKEMKKAIEINNTPGLSKITIRIFEIDF